MAANHLVTFDVSEFQMGEAILLQITVKRKGSKLNDDDSNLLLKIFRGLISQIGVMPTMCIQSLTHQ